MKKKVIALILYVALLMTSLIPATALAEGEDTGSPAPVCTCTTKCSDGNVNPECPVCGAEGADLDGCQGAAVPSTRSAIALNINSVSLKSKTYDGTTEGEEPELTFKTTDPSASMGSAIFNATVEYDDPNAGDNRTATVTVTLIGDDYIFEGGKKETTYTLEGQTIKKRPVELDWGNTSFIYDGKEKSVSATISNVLGNDDVQPVYGGITSATEASASYTAKVIQLSGSNAGNYTLEGGTNLSQEWSIKIDITYDTTVSYSGGYFYYNGKEQTPNSSVIFAYDKNVNPLKCGEDYTLSYENNINAGEATIKVNGTGKYTGTTLGSFTILPAKLTISGANLEPKTYDGTTQGTVKSVEFTGVPEGQSLKLGVDYTATVEYDSADAGDGKTATVTVTLKNSNYSLKVNTFTLPNQTIEKADYEGNKTADGYIVADSSLHSVKLPDIPEGASYGKPEYSGGDDAVTSLSITDGILHYSGGSITSGSKYTVTVPVAGGNNYEDYDITVSLTGSNSVVLSGEPTLSTDTITYGDMLGNITLSGSMYAGATPISGTFTWDTNPYTIPKAGTYQASWSFVPEDALYSKTTGSVTITVRQRPVVIEWSGPTEFTYDGQKHSVSATITNTVEGDDVHPVYGGTLSATDIETYTATVTGLNGTNAGNYTLVGVSNVSQEWSIKSPVTLVSSVTMSRSSLRIYEGKSYSLSAAVSPADATDKSLYWGSSNPDIATVDQNGKVTGKAPGVCTIFAQAQDGSKVFAACSVRVLHWYPGATPITGDSSHLGLWIGVLAVSACAIGAAAFILIKKRKSK